MLYWNGRKHKYVQGLHGFAAALAGLEEHLVYLEGSSNNSITRIEFHLLLSGGTTRTDITP